MVPVSSNPDRSHPLMKASATLAILLSLSVVGQPAFSREIEAISPNASAIEPAKQSFGSEAWAVERAEKIQADLRDEKLVSNTKVLFLGDSITQFWLSHGEAVWQEAFGNPDFAYPAVNLGFSGDRTENLLFHLVEENSGGEGFLENPRLAPKVIVLLIGVNNTWDKDERVIDQVVAGNIAAIARLRQLRPDAKIIVQSLLPTQDVERSRDIIQPINQKLSEILDGLDPKVSWLDVYPLFAAKDGGPRADLFVDTVHPSAAGYAIWKPELVNALDLALAGEQR